MFNPSNRLKLIQKENDLLIHPIQSPPYVSIKSTFEVEKVPQATSALAPASFLSSNVGKISPIVLLTIIILAAVFFISACLHLLFRYLVNRPPSRSLFNSNRFSFNTDHQASTSHVLQRQLQQLFRLHDSGLDQKYIDSLPVFYYKDVLIGLDLNMKPQFDCAVCLSEFSNQDKLQLLPLCSHAFHINCIDPWLMSNSTCPLCRSTLVHPPTNLPSLHQMTSYNDSSEMSLSLSTGSVNSTSTSISYSVSSSSTATLDEKRVYSVRFGKFRTLSNIDNDISISSKLDGRRYYSMGSYQSIVTHDSDLKVALELKHWKVKGGQDGDDDHCVSIGGRSSLRVNSFSVSKIWLWSKKRKYEDHHNCDSKTARLGRLEPL